MVYRRINELYQEKQLQVSELMKGILELAIEALGAEGGSLWICHPQSKQIECRAAAGEGSDLILGIKIPAGKGIVGWVVAEQRSTVVEDTSKDERFYSKVDRNQKFSTRTLVANPLVYAGEVIGAMEFVNKSDPNSCFTPNDIPFLEDICTPVAMHLKSSLARQRQEQLLKRLESFSELHTTFCSTLDLKQLLKLVLGRAIELLGAEVGSLWLVAEPESSDDSIVCHVAEGPTRDKVEGLQVKKGQGIIGWSVEHLEPTLVEDCAKDSRFASTIDKKIDFVTRSMITAPLRVQDEAIGALQIINKKGEGNFFQREDLELLVLFANSAAMYIKNARLFASEKKAKELTALIDISKQIAATLDLDSVLMTIVNLANDIVEYDSAAISIQPSGKSQFEIHAISGVEKIDREAENTKALTAIHAKMGSLKREISISSRDAYSKSPEAVPEIVEYMSKKKLDAFFGCVLTDDQGELGILTMEFNEGGGVTEAKREILSILISQCTVAIRNATLYTTIPHGSFFGSGKDGLRARLAAVRAWPKQQLLLAMIACVLLFSGFVLVRVPYYASAQVELLPVAVTSYAETQGKVADVFVKEGQAVQPGDVLIKVDVAEVLLQRSQKQSSRAKAASEMIKLQGEDRIAEFKIKEKEVLSLDSELELLDWQIASAEIRASHAGVVVTQDLDKLLGMPVSYGQELIKIAKTDEAYVQFQIPESDAEGIRAGNPARFKLYGLPNITFAEGITLRSVAGEGRKIAESDPGRYFTAIASVKADTQGATLRPGMTGRGKIFVGKRSLFYTTFGKPLGALLLKLFY